MGTNIPYSLTSTGQRGTSYSPNMLSGFTNRMNGIGDAGGIMGGVGFNPEENEDAELYVPVDEDTLASRQILKRELAKIGRQNKVNLLTDDQVKALINQVNAGNLITVSNEAGGYTVAFSDGTNWRRVQDRAIVS